MTAVTHGVVILGVEGHIVDVEVDRHDGLPGTTIVGLPDTAVGEARDRARAAIINSGCRWPDGRLTVALSPASLHKRGSTLDLAIAVGILARAGEVPDDSARDVVCIGELGLDGRVRALPGIVVAALAALRAGRLRIVVPMANVDEARLVPDIDVIGVASVRHLVAILRREHYDVESQELAGSAGKIADVVPATPIAQADLADVRGQAGARIALEIAAAGGHHLALVGPPGVGKTLLAERLPGLLPQLSAHEALEVTAIHSVAGRLPQGVGLLRTPPFEAPHHSTTHVAMIGGGGHVPRAGLASLAHRGVLFLDEAPEFNARVLDSLRQPLEAGHVVVARAGFALRFPARFQLVLAANPCPCGRTGPRGGCTCTSAARLRYFSRISGPLLDRIDLRVDLPKPSRAELLADTAVESSASVAARVLGARDRARHRYVTAGWQSNGEVPGPVLRREFPADEAGTRVLADALDLGVLSARGADRLLRVAWTVADLAGAARPSADHVHSALAFRQAGDQWR
jgi:magnesium chelatase family protein